VIKLLFEEDQHHNVTLEDFKYLKTHHRTR
jgi:hypothetical protein